MPPSPPPRPSNPRLRVLAPSTMPTSCSSLFSFIILSLTHWLLRVLRQHSLATPKRQVDVSQELFRLVATCWAQRQGECPDILRHLFWEKIHLKGDTCVHSHRKNLVSWSSWALQMVFHLAPLPTFIAKLLKDSCYTSFLHCFFSPSLPYLTHQASVCWSVPQRSRI